MVLALVLVPMLMPMLLPMPGGCNTVARPPG